MATKFETKWVITQLVWEISSRFLHLEGDFGVGYWMMPGKFYHNWIPLPWQWNLRQNAL